MAYVKTPNDRVVAFPYTLERMRRDNPNVSFPQNPPEQVLASFGVFKVEVEEPPKVDEKTKKAVRDNVPAPVEGRWVLGWRVVEKNQKEREEYYDLMAATVRRRREDLLQETDWMALSDTPPMSAAWASYRQALRDITDQAGFPYDVTWPTTPE